MGKVKFDKAAFEAFAHAGRLGRQHEKPSIGTLEMLRGCLGADKDVARRLAAIGISEATMEGTRAASYRERIPRPEPKGDGDTPMGALALAPMAGAIGDLFSGMAKPAPMTVLLGEAMDRLERAQRRKLSAKEIVLELIADPSSAAAQFVAERGLTPRSIEEALYR